MEIFVPISTNIRTNVFEIVNTTIAPGRNGLTVLFDYNSKEPYSYRIMDVTGRVVVEKNRNAAMEGLNVIDMTISKGAY